jgi:hypothetical protein
MTRRIAILTFSSRFFPPVKPAANKDHRESKEATAVDTLEAIKDESDDDQTEQKQFTNGGSGTKESSSKEESNSKYASIHVPYDSLEAKQRISTAEKDGRRRRRSTSSERVTIRKANSELSNASDWKDRRSKSARLQEPAKKTS